MSARRPDAPGFDATAEVLAALGRAAVWGLLGEAFAYPTAPRLDAVARNARYAAERGDLTPALCEALRALADAAREGDVSVLAEEHVFLFDRQVHCPPWEGAWGDAPRMAGTGAALADIAGFYRAFGLELTAEHLGAEDHLAAELEFMGVLALKEAWGRGQGTAEGLAVTQGAQVAFLADHLGRWAQPFARALAEATPAPYYTQAAAALEGWVAQECERLGVTPTPFPGRLGPDPLQTDVLTCPMAPAEESPEGSMR